MAASTRKWSLTFRLLATCAPLSLAVPTAINANAVAQESASAEENEAASPGRVLGTVMVTSQRREENLQDVPISVTAMSGDDLQEKGLSNIAQIGDFAGNVEIDQTAAFGGSSQVFAAFIRGVGQNDFAFNFEPGVGVYVDGVFFARSQGAVVDLLDLERVEILKGPQGTLFGRNTIGGAVNVITSTPDGVFGGKGEVTYGRFDRVDVRGAVQFPIIDDLLAGSVAFSSKNRAGYQEIIPFPGGPLTTDESLFAATRVDGPGFDDPGGENTDTVRAKLHLTPSDRISVTASADYMRVNEPAVPSTLVAINNGIDPVTNVPTLVNIYNTCIALPVAILDMTPLAGVCNTPRARVGTALGGANADADPTNDRLFFNEQFITGDIDRTYGNGSNFSFAETWGASATIDVDLTDTVSLKSITAFRSADSRFGQDADGSPLAFLDVSFAQVQDQVSQEFQLSGASYDDRWNWLLGATYLQEDGSLTNNVQFAEGLVQVFGGDVGSQFDNKAIGLFTHHNFQATDQLGFTLGVRYTTEDKDFVGFEQELNSLASLLGAPPFLFPDPTNLTLYIPTEPQSRSFENVNYRLGAEYALTDDILTYISYATGFKSGGFNSRLTAPVLEVPTFDEETVETYEVGWKSRLLGKTLQLNAAAFWSNYDDIQVIVIEGTAPLTANAGAATIRGFEADINWLATDELTLAGSIGYLDTEYTELAPDVPIPADAMLVNAPEFSISVNGDYTVPLSSWGSASFRASYTHKTEIANDAQNTPELVQGPVDLVTASVALRPDSENWEFSIGGLNLTDERYVVSGFNQAGGGSINGIYSRPREWYAQLSFSF